MDNLKKLVKYKSYLLLLLLLIQFFILLKVLPQPHLSLNRKNGNVHIHITDKNNIAELTDFLNSSGFILYNPLNPVSYWDFDQWKLLDSNSINYRFLSMDPRSEDPWFLQKNNTIIYQTDLNPYFLSIYMKWKHLGVLNYYSAFEWSILIISIGIQFIILIRSFKNRQGFIGLVVLSALFGVIEPLFAWWVPLYSLYLNYIEKEKKQLKMGHLVIFMGIQSVVFLGFFQFWISSFMFINTLFFLFKKEDRYIHTEHRLFEPVLLLGKETYSRGSTHGSYFYAINKGLLLVLFLIILSSFYLLFTRGKEDFMLGQTYIDTQIEQLKDHLYFQKNITADPAFLPHFSNDQWDYAETLPAASFDFWVNQLDRESQEWQIINNLKKGKFISSSSMVWFLFSLFFCWLTILISLWQSRTAFNNQISFVFKKKRRLKVA